MSSINLLGKLMAGVSKVKNLVKGGGSEQAEESDGNGFFLLNYNQTPLGFIQGIRAFHQYDSQQINDMTTRNYAIYSNWLAMELNRLELPQHSEAMLEYIKEISGNISDDKFFFINDQIGLSAVNTVCDLIYERQFDALNRSKLGNDSVTTYEEFLANIFDLFVSAETKKWKNKEKLKINKFGCPLARIASELTTALNFYQQNSLYPKTEQLIKNVLIELVQLENKALTFLAEPANIAPKSDGQVLDYNNTMLAAFRSAAEKLEILYNECNENAFSHIYFKQGLDDSNVHFVCLHITSRFLSLISMLKMVGNFTFKLHGSSSALYVPKNSFGVIKEMMLNFILSLADLSKVVDDKCIPAMKSSLASSFVGYVNFNTYLDSLSTHSKLQNIINPYGFDPTDQSIIEKSENFIIQLYYQPTMKKSFEIVAQRSDNDQTLSPFFTFLNFSCFAHNVQLQQKLIDGFNVAIKTPETFPSSILEFTLKNELQNLDERIEEYLKINYVSASAMKAFEDVISNEIPTYGKYIEIIEQLFKIAKEKGSISIENSSNNYIKLEHLQILFIAVFSIALSLSVILVINYRKNN